MPIDSHDTRDPQNPHDPNDRLQRLEEAAGFTSHDVDQLRDAVLAIERRLRECTDRLARLEARLDGLADPDADEGDAPGAEPHQPGPG